MLSQLLKTPILIPTDFSEASLQLVNEALKSGIDPSKIHVIYVLQPFSPAAPASVRQTTTDQQRIENVQNTFWKKHQKKLYRDINFQVVKGDDISEEIMNYATRKNIGTVIIASHGYKGLTHWLKGSIAEKLVVNSSLPVLVIPRQETQNNYYDAKIIEKLERIFQELS